MSPKLPPVCFAVHPTDGVPILLLRGEEGYLGLETGEEFGTLQAVADWVREHNEKLGVNQWQMEAMITGSVFGSWDAKGADPDYLEQLHLNRLARKGA